MGEMRAKPPDEGEKALPGTSLRRKSWILPPDWRLWILERGMRRVSV